ncbi:MAG TPA: polyprenol monophosphomannose synthase [Candidatus Thermoplasmatota archaeon]|nr:polyprenol monophosphomannose synthase [Candidatus Thermoplasmatota archaeon]
MRTSPNMERAPRLVSIVVPTYNERQNLPRLIAAIAENMPWPYEIVVVDDSSPDGTADLARDLAKTYPVRLLSRPQKSGLGSAYRDGFAEAKGDVIFEMDADLSHDPRFIPDLVQGIMDGADVCVGSRYVDGGHVVGWNSYRRLVSGVGNTLARMMLRVGVRDLTSGYRCYTREAADLVQLVRSDGYAFQVESLYLVRKSGMRIQEVPIVFENRTVGKSKLGPSEFARFVQTLARLRVTRVPARRATPARAP